MSSNRQWAGRLLLFGGSLPAGALAWAALHEPARGAGCLALAAAAEIFLPGLALCVITAPLAVLQHLIPRSVLIRRRKAARLAGVNRPPLTARFKRIIRCAYRNRCVYCHRRKRLEYEHIMPWSRGGRSVLWNMTLLCHWCNEAKLSYWQERDGWEADGYGRVNKQAARAILRRERWARRNPLVWWRACWAWF